jgi:uncharacterized protein (DUF983 family)
MSPPKDTGPVPGLSPEYLRWQKWISRAYAFAAACLGALAIIEATDTATPLLRTILMIGIVLAGTAAWAMQAQRKCPQCGAQYGYHFRFMRANICRKCGAEFPRWHPGQSEEDGPSRE